MTCYHIIIATERRTDPARMAVSIPAEEPQLHSITAHGLPENLDDPQFVMVASWNGSDPYVIQHKGDYSTCNNRYAGWPEITKEEFDALPISDPVAA